MSLEDEACLLDSQANYHTLQGAPGVSSNVLQKRSAFKLGLMSLVEERGNTGEGDGNVSQ